MDEEVFLYQLSGAPLEYLLLDGSAHLCCLAATLRQDSSEAGSLLPGEATKQAAVNYLFYSRSTFAS